MMKAFISEEDESLQATAATIVMPATRKHGELDSN
jgi:hypothetical protein